MSAKHLLADLTSQRDGLRLAYLDQQADSSSDEKGIILLIHGFPQTSYQFRHVLPLLSRSGFRCIAPDYRGAGGSSKPADGFTKSSMAEDMVALLDHLCVDTPVHVIGHDIGGMVAFALASRHAERVQSVCWGECPLPGTEAYGSDRTDHAVQQFHFIFHSVPDLPEALVAGKERIYITHFLYKICHNLNAFTEEDISHYVAAYAQPGGMRCAFDVYRSFDEDAQENTRWIAENGRCMVPTLLLSGEFSRHKDEALSMASETSKEGLFELGTVPDSAHYLAEENPQGFVDSVLSFVGKHLSSSVPIG